MCRRLILFASALLPLLGACAVPEGVYPSLATRDLERVPMDSPSAPEQGEDDSLALSNALARTGAPRQAVIESHEAFLATAERIRPRVTRAKDAARGSVQWSDAQVAIAELEGHRQTTMVSIADIDRIYIETATQTGDLEVVGAVREEMNALLLAEDRLIAELLSAIAP